MPGTFLQDSTADRPVRRCVGAWHLSAGFDGRSSRTPLRSNRIVRNGAWHRTRRRACRSLTRAGWKRRVPGTGSVSGVHPESVSSPARCIGKLRAPLGANGKLDGGYGARHLLARFDWDAPALRTSCRRIRQEGARHLGRNRVVRPMPSNPAETSQAPTRCARAAARTRRRPRGRATSARSRRVPRLRGTVGSCRRLRGGGGGSRRLAPGCRGSG